MSNSRARDSIYYRELAEAIAPRYPQISPAAIHLWAHRGLLTPAPTLRERRALAPEAVAQLERVCHYRFDEQINRLDWIAVLIWLDGFPVPFRVLVEALLPVAIRLDRIDARRSSEAANQAEIDRLVTQLQKFARSLQSASGIQRDDLADLVEELVSAVRGAEPSEYLRQVLARLSGESIDRADLVADRLRHLAERSWRDIAASGQADYESARGFWRHQRLGDLVPIGRSAKTRVRLRSYFAWFLRAMQFDQFMRAVTK